MPAGGPFTNNSDNACQPGRAARAHARAFAANFLLLPLVAPENLIEL